jgi:hypothetical protein
VKINHVRLQFEATVPRSAQLAPVEVVQSRDAYLGMTIYIVIGTDRSNECFWSNRSKFRMSRVFDTDLLSCGLLIEHGPLRPAPAKLGR